MNHLPMQEMQVQSLGWEDLLEKEMATHSSNLAWRIPWAEEPGKPQAMGSQRVGCDWATKQQQFLKNARTGGIGKCFRPLKMSKMWNSLLHSFPPWLKWCGQLEGGREEWRESTSRRSDNPITYFIICLLSHLDAPSEAEVDGRRNQWTMSSETEFEPFMISQKWTVQCSVHLWKGEIPFILCRSWFCQGEIWAKTVYPLPASLGAQWCHVTLVNRM